MRFKQVGNKSDAVAVVVKSAETSADIPVGTPVVLAINGANDGLAVVLPSTAGNAKTGGFAYGIANGTIAAGNYGESVVFGIVSNAILLRGTRAGTNANWSSSESFASGAILMIDTVQNCLKSTVASLAATSYGPMFVLAQSLVSTDSFASSDATSGTGANSDTRTIVTAAVKVFVRML